MPNGEKDTISNLILVHVDVVARAPFFLELAQNLTADHDFRSLFITESPAAARYLKERSAHVTLLQGKSACVTNEVTGLYATSLCGVLGAITLRAAAGYLGEIRKITQQHRPCVIWCWNGSKFIDRALKSTGLPLRTFEVANLPGHFVVEQGGVNAESATYRNLVLENAPVAPSKDFDFAQWRTDYIAAKEEQRSIPQAKLPSDEIGDKLRHLFSPDRLTFRFAAFQIDRIMGYLAKPLIARALSRIANARKIKGRVVFFPQQVSTDTQLIFNSDIDNAGALDLLIGELESDAVLVSNLHPAEHRLSQMLAFLRKCRGEPRLVPATSGAWALVKQANRVVTINSTVGLEAAILGKDCNFLGRSLFGRLARDNVALQWFISCHILPQTLISERPLSPRLVARILPDAAV